MSRLPAHAAPMPTPKPKPKPLAQAEADFTSEGAPPPGKVAKNPPVTGELRHKNVDEAQPLPDQRK